MKEVKRKLSRSLYITALFYALFLLFIGFIFGFVYDRYISQNVGEDISVLSDISFTSEILYAIEGTKEFCEIYPFTIKKVEEETWRIGAIIDKLESSNRLDKRLKERYFDMELRDYFLTKRASESCNISSFVIIYFYSNNRAVCSSCYSQGMELTIARNELINKNVSVKIYAFDEDSPNPILNHLKQKYSIKKYPSLILIYKDKYIVISGFSDSKKIVNTLYLLSKPSFS